MFLKEWLLVICPGTTWGASLKMCINGTCGINMRQGGMRPNSLSFKLALQVILYATSVGKHWSSAPLFSIPDKWPLACS